MSLCSYVTFKLIAMLAKPFIQHHKNKQYFHEYNKEIYLSEMNLQFVKCIFNLHSNGVKITVC